MRVLVVADVHSNIEALDAVLAQAGAVDTVWSLGDLVGYGPDPSACIERLRSLPHVAVAGNHDLAAVGEIGTEDFNPYAAEAVKWTGEQLSDDDRDWLRRLPRVASEGDFTLVHGSLRDPVWEYLFTPFEARDHLALQHTPYSFVGHTHIPRVFYESGSEAPEDGASVELTGRRFVANPGGLGQPRDGNPRAAYAILDTEARRIEFCRVAYDIASTQANIRAAGLPSFLADRLAHGR